MCVCVCVCLCQSVCAILCVSDVAVGGRLALAGLAEVYENYNKSTFESRVRNLEAIFRYEEICG